MKSSKTMLATARKFAFEIGIQYVDVSGIPSEGYAVPIGWLKKLYSHEGFTEKTLYKHISRWAEAKEVRHAGNYVFFIPEVGTPEYDLLKKTCIVGHFPVLEAEA